MFYSGIDLHWDNCYITTVDDTGAIVKQQRVVNSPEMLLNYFRSMDGPHRSVVESTMGWYWLDDLLEDNGIELVLAHAKYLKAISYAKVKTDKVDSRTLATLLRQDLIPRAHKIDRSLRGLRDTMRARLRLVQKRTTSTVMLNTIRVKFNFPETLPAQYQLYAQMLEEQTNLLSEHILALEKSLHPRLIPNEDIQRLLRIPGIGKISAFTIYLEIDGIERFPTVKHFLSYCRLVPGAENSNRHIHHRSSKDGNKYLKLAFSDAGVRAMQYFPEYRAFYQKMLKRSNQPIARALVAKEIAKIAYYVLTNHSPYRGLKGQPISHQKSAQWPRLPSPNA